MAEAEALAYLEKQLNEQIDGFDSSRKFFRGRNLQFAIATAVLSSGTTVFIGVGEMVPTWAAQWLSAFALISSAAVAVVATFDGFFRTKEQWLQKTDTWMALQNLRAKIEYAKAKSSGPLTQDDIDTLYSRFDSILMGEHEKWKLTQAESKAEISK